MDERHWRYFEPFALLRGLLGPEILHRAAVGVAPILIRFCRGGTHEPRARCLPDGATPAAPNPKDHLPLPEVGMRCTIACAIALPLFLTGCGEPVEPASDVARRGKLVKTCPSLRAVYAWQDKLYVKDGERYHQVERTTDELCDMTARYEAHVRDR